MRAPKWVWIVVIVASLVCIEAAVIFGSGWPLVGIAISFGVVELFYPEDAPDKSS